jgi:hypothetical protein
MKIFRGSESEILTVLWGLSIRDDFHGEYSNGAEFVVDFMSEAIEGGALAVTSARLGRFEVVQPVWSLEQDIYGCEHGRDCPDVTPEERARFEAMIAARLAAEPEAEG